MKTVTGLLLMLSSMLALGAIDAYEFPDEQMEQRYHQLIAELRCPQCLNTNLAGSDAMIAADLRREVHRLLLEGKSNEEILTFMHARYGDFILYEPRLTAGTLALWFGPLILLLVAALVVGRLILNRRRLAAETPDTALDEGEQARLRRLLSGR